MAKSAVLQRSKKNKALKLFQSGHPEEARQILASICRTSKTCPDAETWCLLGFINGQLEEYQESKRCCSVAVQLAPGYTEAHYNLSQACMHMGLVDEAIAAYRQVVSLQPDHPSANNNLGLALAWKGKYEEAIASYHAALKLNPADTDALLNLGAAAQSLSGYEAGTEYYRRALTIDPENFKALIALGLCLIRSGNIEQASDCFEKAGRLGQDPVEITLGLAYLEERRGNFDKAFELIEPMLESPDDYPVFLAFVFARVAGPVGRREQAVELLERALQRSDIKPSDTQSLYFEMGTLYDKLKNYDKALSYFNQGNALARLGNNHDKFLEVMEGQQRVCTAAFFRNAANSGNRSERPVFIVGMPRSGTTLTEQILASHPQVYSGGERSDIGDIAERWQVQASTNGGYPHCLQTVDRSTLAGLAGTYLEKVADETGEVLRITDKMPHNFIHLGLIALLFPEARVIHCRRDPMDTCLSIYSHDFNLAHPYATNLSALGQHYRQYERLMAHWKQVLPLPIFEVKYEEMVSDQERLSRELVSFCDLPWNDACLKFYESCRLVSTFSYRQVQQPIYQQSVERWRNYMPGLEPLRSALGLVDQC